MSPQDTVFWRRYSFPLNWIYFSPQKTHDNLLLVVHYLHLSKLKFKIPVWIRTTFLLFSFLNNLFLQYFYLIIYYYEVLIVGFNHYKNFQNGNTTGYKGSWPLSRCINNNLLTLSWWRERWEETPFWIPPLQMRKGCSGMRGLKAVLVAATMKLWTWRSLWERKEQQDHNSTDFGSFKYLLGRIPWVIFWERRKK